MSTPHVLLAGASGLVGGQVLDALLADARFSGRIVAPTRRSLGRPGDSRLQEIITDFASFDGDAGLGAAIQADGSPPLTAFVSCLGTTIKAAGSRAAFIAVDRDLVLRLAQLAFDSGARHAILVSSAGASRQSGNFYLRIKGEVEDALERIGFTRLDILQPGLLLGKRADHRRAESFGKLLAPVAGLLMRGKLRQYRPIRASTVAAAIAALLLSAGPAGIHEHRYDGILSLAG